MSHCSICAAHSILFLCQRSDSMRYKGFSFVISLAVCLLAMPAQGQRIMEKLGRGFVAVWGSNRRGQPSVVAALRHGTGHRCRLQRVQGHDKTQCHTDHHLNQLSGQRRRRHRLHSEAIVGGVEEATGTKALSLPNGYLESRSRTQAVGRSILPMSAISTAMANTNTSWTVSGRRVPVCRRLP